MTKPYPDKDRIRLDGPVPTSDIDFFQVLLNRRTCRNFSPKRNTSKALFSTLMHFVARAHGFIKNPYFGIQMLKTSPSGGQDILLRYTRNFFGSMGYRLVISIMILYIMRSSDLVTFLNSKFTLWGASIWLSEYGNCVYCYS